MRLHLLPHTMSQGLVPQCRLPSVPCCLHCPGDGSAVLPQACCTHAPVLACRVAAAVGTVAAHRSLWADMQAARCSHSIRCGNASKRPPGPARAIAMGSRRGRVKLWSDQRMACCQVCLCMVYTMVRAGSAGCTQWLRSAPCKCGIVDASPGQQDSGRRTC
jgi:hypothetical protein